MKRRSRPAPRETASRTFATWRTIPTEHPGINNDTLHLQGWLDLSAEPVIISVPGMDKGRCWILHTLDMGHYTTSMSG
ncbi:DUF1254 domain-containing protein [Aeromonas caviae]|uniref:DUF1254 domain-containing protein n=1 Tax=Aeromonas caviae TaxID=648 RepID=UPI002441CCE8|nr:DUF1254 domain-containing protein [Aeromonas caviae]